MQVTATQDGANFTAARQGYRHATRTDLVYFDNSPDYCVLDKAAGEKEEAETWSLVISTGANQGSLVHRS